MKNKIIVLIIVVILILLLGGALFIFRQNNNEVNNEVNNENNINIENKIEEREDFSIDFAEDVDHYVMTVKTNIVDEEFKFKYSIKDFMLDISSNLFDDVTFEEAEGFRSCSLKLESNALYKFYFIKKSNTKLKLGNNLIVNE